MRLRPRDPRAHQQLDHRKARDRALVLPIVGLLLLMPPIAGVFQVELRVAGVPLTAIYLFAVWAGLIAAAALLAPRLSALARQPWRADAVKSGEGLDTDA